MARSSQARILSRPPDENWLRKRASIHPPESCGSTVDPMPADPLMVRYLSSGCSLPPLRPVVPRSPERAPRCAGWVRPSSEGSDGPLPTLASAALLWTHSTGCVGDELTAAARTVSCRAARRALLARRAVPARTAQTHRVAWAHPLIPSRGGHPAPPLHPSGSTTPARARQARHRIWAHRLHERTHCRPANASLTRAPVARRNRAWTAQGRSATPRGSRAAQAQAPRRNRRR